MKNWVILKKITKSYLYPNLKKKKTTNTVSHQKNY